MLRAYVRKTDHSLLINLSAQQLGIAGETRSNEDPPRVPENLCAGRSFWSKLLAAWRWRCNFGFFDGDFFGKFEVARMIR